MLSSDRQPSAHGARGSFYGTNNRSEAKLPHFFKALKMAPQTEQFIIKLYWVTRKTEREIKKVQVGRWNKQDTDYAATPYNLDNLIDLVWHIHKVMHSTALCSLAIERPTEVFSEPSATQTCHGKVYKSRPSHVQTKHMVVTRPSCHWAGWGQADLMRGKYGLISQAGKHKAYFGGNPSFCCFWQTQHYPMAHIRWRPH